MKRFGLVGLVALSALALSACDDSGDGGGAGGERSGEGTGAGANGDDESCTVEDNGDGTATITCADGTEVDVSTTPATEIEQCSVEDNGDGTATITCPDGSSVTTGVQGFGSNTIQFVQQLYDLTLYRVTGSTVERFFINEPLGSAASISTYVVSADKTKVLYSADLEADDVIDLYLVDISGDQPGPSVKVNAPLQASGDIASFAFSPDGNWVAYRADQAVDDLYEAYVVDISGDEPAAPVKVNGPLLATGDVTSFAFSPNSELLAVLQDRTNEAVDDLYVVELASPGAGVRVNPALLAGRSVEADYAFSADSSELYYRADQLTADVVELFVSDVSDGTPAVPVEVSQIDAGTVTSYFVSPNAQSVVYVSSADGQFHLVDSGSRGTAALLYPTDDAPVISTAGAGFSGDSSQFVFMATNLTDADSYYHVVSVGIDGDTPDDVVDLSANVSTSSVASFALSPSGERAVYLLDHDVDGYEDLFFVNLEDPSDSPPRVNPPLPAYMSVGEYAWAERVDVVRWEHPVGAYSENYGAGVADLSGAAPGAPRLFLEAAQWESYYYPALSEDGAYLYYGAYYTSDSFVRNVATGIGVELPSQSYYPIEFVNPLD